MFMTIDIEAKIYEIVSKYKKDVKDLRSIENQVKFIVNQTKITSYLVSYMRTILGEALMGSKDNEISEMMNTLLTSSYGDLLTGFVSLVLILDIPDDKIPDKLRIMTT